MFTFNLIQTKQAKPQKITKHKQDLRSYKSILSCRIYARYTYLNKIQEISFSWIFNFRFTTKFFTAECSKIVLKIAFSFEHNKQIKDLFLDNRVKQVENLSIVLNIRYAF